MIQQPLAKSCAFLLLVLCLFPQAALAYVGPGAGLSAIGACLAIVVAVIAAIFGFVWYPIKRLMRKWNRRSGNLEGGAIE